MLSKLLGQDNYLSGFVFGREGEHAPKPNVSARAFIAADEALKDFGLLGF